MSDEQTPDGGANLETSDVSQSEWATTIAEVQAESGAAVVDTTDDDEVEVPGDEAPLEDPEEDAEGGDDGIPEKFRGKSKAEIARAYQELERDRGRIANELGELRQRVPAMQEEEAAAVQARGVPPTDDGAEDAEQQARVLALARTEYQHLLSLGFEDTEELRMRAIAVAQERDDYTQNLVAQATAQAVKPFQQFMAPTVISQDVSGILEISPVQGVEAAELAGMIAQAVPLAQWQAASVEERAMYVLGQAKQIAYDKFVAQQAAAGSEEKKAPPPQTPPDALGAAKGATKSAARNPQLENEMKRQRIMFPDLGDADIKELAEDALSRRR